MRRSSRMLVPLVASLTLIGSLSTVAAVAGTGTAAHSAFPIAPKAVNNLDCNGWSEAYKPVSGSFRMHCTDPISFSGGEYGSSTGRFDDNGHYVGHDEPSVRFESTAANSGNSMTYYMQLPVDPAAAPTTSGTAASQVTDTAELTPAPWFGLAICDPNSFGAFYDTTTETEDNNSCTADSDTNTSSSGLSFMELQLYPPKIGPFIDAPSCDATRWCVALTIDALTMECPTSTFNADACSPNPSCVEPVNFAYLTRDGVPTGPPGPEDATAATETPNADTLYINPGDTIELQIVDTPVSSLPALEAKVTDFSTGQSGFMVASAANGFQTVDPGTCDGTTMDFHAAYATASPGNTVGWSALEGGVLMEQEIGHGEACGSVADQLPSSLTSLLYPAPFSDPNTYEVCSGGYEDSTGEGPCDAASPYTCSDSTTEDGAACAAPQWQVEAGAPQLCEFADATCIPAGPRTVTTQQTTDGVNPRTVQQTWDSPIPFCEANFFQNGDLDFDGASYQSNTWPNGGGNTPTPFRYVGPFDAAGNLYPDLQYETDAPGSEFLCNPQTGTQCVVPPEGAAFYPYFSITNKLGQLPGGLHSSTGTPCVWNFGNTIAGVTTDDFSGDSQYGSPDTSSRATGGAFEGTLITGGSRTSDISNPVDGGSNGASGTCTAITQSDLSFKAFTQLSDVSVYGSVGTDTSPSSGSSSSPLWSANLGRSVAELSDGSGGYFLDGYGGVHPFGSAQAAHISTYWPGVDIARSIVLLPNDTGGYVMDGYGGIHPFSVGSNAMPPMLSGTPYWKGYDIAKQILLISASSGYVLDAYGGLHAFGGAPAFAVSAYWPGFDIARGVAIDVDGLGGYVLDGYGGLHAFGNARPVATPAYWPGFDIARAIVIEPGTNSEGWFLDGYGGLHPWGGAAIVLAPGYSSGHDIYRSLAVA